MLVLTTGDPVPQVLETRGAFSAMFRDAAKNVYEGPVESLDARSSLPASLPDGVFLVISGSSAHVPDREPWVQATESFLRDVVSKGIPTLGVCFGHQLLAQALGGEVVRNPRGREIGTIEIHLTSDDPILEGVPKTFRANATHLDTVGSLPPNARKLAKSAKDDHQIVRFAEACYGVHPEIDPFIMHGYLEARRPVLETEGLDVEDHKARTEDAPFAIRVLENFIRASR
jgi:GMP synthase (glutamine-hydrolysing)